MRETVALIALFMALLVVLILEQVWLDIKVSSYSLRRSSSNKHLLSTQSFVEAGCERLRRKGFGVSIANTTSGHVVQISLLSNIIYGAKDSWGDYFTVTTNKTHMINCNFTIDIDGRDLSNLGTNSRFFDREFLVRAKVNNSNEQNTVVHLMKRCQGGKLESIENVTKLASYFPIHHPANWRSLQDAKERRHKTCALVGNSGSLNGSFHGAAIDKHEAVIRINNAPTINFSEHVGSITSYRIVNNLAFQHRPEGQEILIPLSSICPSDLALIRKQAIWFLERQPKSYSTAYNTMKIDGHPYHMYFKSSGVDSVYLALHLCERTDVYGMTIDMETGGYRHYYDKRLAAGHTVIQNILLYRFIEAFLPDRIQFN